MKLREMEDWEVVNELRALYATDEASMIWLECARRKIDVGVRFMTNRFFGTGEPCGGYVEVCGTKTETL